MVGTKFSRSGLFKRKRERGGSPPPKCTFANPKGKDKQD
jgi:hypothetical protein